MAGKRSDQVDRIVGRNVRIFRLEKGLSQTELGSKLGLTFQQVQKYEKGTNRIGSGRLLKIASILGVPIATLFKGHEEAENTSGRSLFDQLAEPNANRLLQAFADIENDGMRRAVVLLVEQIAKST